MSVENVQTAAAGATSPWKPLLPFSLMLILAWIAACISLQPFFAVDLFWQLRAGHDILSTGHPPSFDTYSWDRHGARWSVSEWLTFALYWLVYQHLGGFGGLLALRVLLNVTIVCLLFVFLSRLTRSTTLAFLVSALATTASADYFQTRPYQITFLFVLITAYVIVCVRLARCKPWTLFLLAPLCTLWANLHEGFVVGIALLITYAICDASNALAHRLRSSGNLAVYHGRSAMLFGGASLACMAASLLSPYGVGAYEMILATVNSASTRLNVEWQPLSQTPSLETIALDLWVLIILAGYLFAENRRDTSGIVVVLALAEQTLQHQRNLPLFVLAGSMIAAPQLAALRPLISGVLARRLYATSVALVAVLSVVLWTALDAPIVQGWWRGGGSLWTSAGDMSIGLYAFPEDACRFMEQRHFPAGLRLWNDLGTAGYLIWRLPQDQVIIDGRADIYVGRVFDDYMAAKDSGSPEEFFRIMSPYDFNCAITHDQFVQACFMSNPQWVRVYAGSHYDPTWIFLRREPQWQSLIAECLQGSPVE